MYGRLLVLPNNMLENVGGKKGETKMLDHEQKARDQKLYSIIQSNIDNCFVFVFTNLQGMHDSAVLHCFVI